MEKAISFVGLLTLIGIGYAFSVARRAIQLRTLLWGVGLQLLFAVIILARGTASFVGMSALALLVVFYLVEEELGSRLSGPVAAAAATASGGAAAVALFYFLFAGAAQATAGVLGAAAVGVAAGAVLKRRHLARGSAIGLLLAGVAALWARGVDGRIVFQVVSDKITSFLSLSNLGAKFLFSNLADNRFFGPQEGWPGFGFQFAFAVLPTIIFFSAFMSILYHLGIVQAVVAGMARFMRWTMGTSGSETISCSANVFVGQTEAPFLIKPFLATMTVSELHAVMVGGFATIAGGVMAGYIQMGISAGHLLAASVMSAPAALVMAKLMIPETAHSATAGDVEIPKVKTADNVLGAAAAGVTDGLALALNVAAMLIAFIALIGMLDGIFGLLDRWIDGRLLGAMAAGPGGYPGIFPGSLKVLFGTLLRPLAYLLGVPWADTVAVGNLLGVKLTVNEFVAYSILSEHIHQADISARSITIATYALCGFANFSSIGIQIGGIGALAPGRRGDLARVGLRAMFAGALASWMTAAIAGILL